MMASPSCDCLVCRLEQSLIAELGGDHGEKEFRSFAAPYSTLAAFPTALELINQLHRQQDQQNFSCDQTLLELLGRTNDPAFAPMGQKLLLLVFIPTLHRTTSQITATFPSLTRDDTAQHLFAVLLEFLTSRELQARRSHLAFTIARKIRRSAFRWAIRESRTSLRNEMEGTSGGFVPVDSDGKDGHSGILLEQFLDGCQRRGWLSSEERQLLIEFKLEQMSGRELARRSGHSVVAIRHRVQRLLGRLRRVARKSRPSQPEQLKLFSR
jgi:DNA-directed RNA polymerase specialized sigma24 family protein